MQIDAYLKAALEQRASDIHFSSDEPVRIRVDGDLVSLNEDKLSNEQLQSILFEILTEPEQERAIVSKNIDKSYTFGDLGFFRVNIFWTRKGISAVLRTIPCRIPTLADLALPDSVRQLSEATKGLVLVTGPTGSGKSTTLAAMINHINANFPYHILTAEDPVEFVHPSKKCLINQREIGASCNTFADALKYALREDPDVILVGEMRDLETIGLALTAAETGHLVFGTLHTRGAGASVDRIIDSFPANQQAMIRTMLAESLIGVVSQTLIKRADGNGRAAAFEVMVVNHAIANLIREGKTFQIASIMQTAKKEGMVLMDAHILELVDNNIVTPEEAAAYMEDGSKLAARKSKTNLSPAKPNSSALAKPSTAPSKTPPPKSGLPLPTKPGPKPLAAPLPPSVQSAPVKPPLPKQSHPTIPLPTKPVPPTLESSLVDTPTLMDDLTSTEDPLVQLGGSELDSELLVDGNETPNEFSNTGLTLESDESTNSLLIGPLGDEGDLSDDASEISRPLLEESQNDIALDPMPQPLPMETKKPATPTVKPSNARPLPISHATGATAPPAPKIQPPIFARPTPAAKKKTG